MNVHGNGSKEKLPVSKLSEEVRAFTQIASRATEAISAPNQTNPSAGPIQVTSPLGDTRERKPQGLLPQSLSESRQSSDNPGSHSRVPSDNQREIRGVPHMQGLAPAAPYTAQLQTRIIERTKPSPPFPSNTLQTPSHAPRVLPGDSGSQIPLGGHVPVSNPPTLPSLAPGSGQPGGAQTNTTIFTLPRPLAGTSDEVGDSQPAVQRPHNIAHERSASRPPDIVSTVVNEQGPPQELAHPSMPPVPKNSQDPSLYSRNRQEVRLYKLSSNFQPHFR